MDIFTTQLTRVVPVTIKPDKLKVKALVKDARVRAFEESLDQLDDHEKVAINPKKESDARHHHSEEKVPDSETIKQLTEELENKPNQNEQDDKDDGEEVHHLDIFV